MMLRHAPALEELILVDCNQISWLLMEETESRSLKHTSTPRASSTSSTPEGLLRIPSNLIPFLKKLIISLCGELTFQGDKDGFSRFTSLEELRITGCPKLIPSLVHKYENNDQRNGRWLLPLSLVKLKINNSPETLQPCFLEDGNCFKKLKIDWSPNLELLQLRSCAALEELVVDRCQSLAALEGNFTCLKELVLHYNSGLESLQLYSCTALEGLTIQYCGSLTALEGNFTCLKKLVLSDNSGLESLQLYSCTALEGLTIEDCGSLTTLEGNFTCLRKLVLHSNSGLESLQLYSCTALERLTIGDCGSLTTLEGNFTYLKELVLFYNSGLELLQLYSCTALEGLTIEDCGSLTTVEGNFTCLRKLKLWDNPRLKSVRLRFCTALEELLIEECESLAALEGLSLRGLRYLRVFGCPSLSHYLEGLSSQGRDQLCAELEIG
jgi:hypothetical protein